VWLTAVIVRAVFFRIVSKQGMELLSAGGSVAAAAAAYASASSSELPPAGMNGETVRHRVAVIESKLADIHEHASPSPSQHVSPARPLSQRVSPVRPLSQKGSPVRAVPFPPMAVAAALQGAEGEHILSEEWQQEGVSNSAFLAASHHAPSNTQL